MVLILRLVVMFWSTITLVEGLPTATTNGTVVMESQDTSFSVYLHLKTSIQYCVEFRIGKTQMKNVEY